METTKDIQEVIKALQSGMNVRVSTDSIHAKVELDRQRVVEVAGNPPTKLVLRKQRGGGTEEVEIESSQFFAIYKPL